MTVVPPLRTSRGARVETFLPVSGTPITAYGQAGTWTVRAYLDGSPVPAASWFFNLVDDQEE